MTTTSSMQKMAAVRATSPATAVARSSVCVFSITEPGSASVTVGRVRRCSAPGGTPLARAAAAAGCEQARPSAARVAERGSGRCYLRLLRLCASTGCPAACSRPGPCSAPASRPSADRLCFLARPPACAAAPFASGCASPGGASAASGGASAAAPPGPGPAAAAACACFLRGAARLSAVALT
jgi:hypothetical protein